MNRLTKGLSRPAVARELAVLLLGGALAAFSGSASAAGGRLAPNNPLAPEMNVLFGDPPLDWDVIQMDEVGCANGATQFTTELSGYTGGPERFRTIVDAAGLRYMDEDAGQPGGGNGNYAWAIYNSSSGGPTTAVFPLPENTPFTVDFRLISGQGGPTVFLRRVTIDRCNGGVIVSELVILFVDGFESGLTLNWSQTVP